jgi:hypothetical protein
MHYSGFPQYQRPKLEIEHSVTGVAEGNITETPELPRRFNLLSACATGIRTGNV